MTVLSSQREAVILNLIQQQGIIAIDDVCTHCNCSPATARRDLSRLESSGQLSRTHGGAMLPTLTPPVLLNAHETGLLEARIALTDRADVLIVTPSETAAMRLLVERARRAGVPIIAEANAYQGAMTMVAVDNYQAGLEVGRWVANYARQYLGGQIKVLDLSYPQPNTEARSRGFADGLRDLPPGQRVLLRMNGEGVRNTARQITADALAVHPDVNVIFGINDDSALGGLDAFRAAGLDERRLLVVPFGLEGAAAKELLEQGGPGKVGVAMFPELVGRACVDAAVCAYHGCALPERVITPFAIVTPDTLERFYRKDHRTGEWSINWAVAERLPAASTGFALLGQCGHRPKPRRIGYVQIFSSHEWYQNLRRSIQTHTRSLDISLEVVDASQDVAQEINKLKQYIGYMAARFVHEGDTIIIDAGLTTMYLAQALRGRQGVTVITNSLPVLAELGTEPGLTLVSSGGVVRSQTQMLSGPGAEATFKDLRADKAFISATGLSLDFGLSNTNIPEAAVKLAMLRAARELFLLVDHTKIGVESLVKIAPLDEIHHLITDNGISVHDRLALTQRGVDVVIAEDGLT
ncbi:MAG: substrate-binding domain-containing protein [Anaerolineae bacterium]